MRQRTPLKLSPWLLASFVSGLLACAGGSQKEPSKEVKEGPEKQAATPPSAKAEGDDEPSDGNFKTFTYSLANSPLTSKTYNRKEAQAVADDLSEQAKKPEFKDRRDLVTLMAARRFAGAGLADV